MKLNKIITISLLTSSLLFGASVKDINKEAIELLKVKNSVEAYKTLKKIYIKGDYNNETLFLLGTSAKQNNDINNAIKYFEELLAKDKGAHRVRLDLASLYYRKGDLNKSKELLLIVKSSQPPKKVGDNIDMFLATIGKGIPKAWTIGLSIGWMYDSNANAGPDTNSVLIYNLPFTLSADAKENSDTAMKYNIGMSYIKKFDSFVWQNTLSLNVVDYTHINTLDSKNIALSTVFIKKIEKLTLSCPLIANALIIGHKNKYYYISTGASPQVHYQYNNKTSLNAAFSFSHKKYYQSPKRESNSIILSPSIRTFIDQSSYVTLGGYIGEETSKTVTYGNYSKGLNAGYFKAFSQYFSIYLGYNYSKTNYKGEEVAYSKSRNDHAGTMSGSVSYAIKAIDSTLTLNVSNTDNKSNIEIYKYSRRQVGFNLAHNF